MDFLERNLNRKARRKFQTKSQMEGKSKKFYTTKQSHRRKNGKRVQRGTKKA